MRGDVINTLREQVSRRFNASSRIRRAAGRLGVELLEFSESQAPAQDPGKTTLELDEDTLQALRTAAVDEGASPEDVGAELLQIATALYQKGKLGLFQDPCESLTMHEDNLSETGFGVWFESGEGIDPETDEPEGEKARRLIEEELRAEGVPATFQPGREYSLGRGAGWVGILVAAVAVFAALKNIDDGIGVLGKWIRAMKRAASRLNASGYTAGFLKACCVEDVGKRLGSLEDVELSMVTCVAALAEGEMEAALIASHYTVTVPVPARRKAFIFVITQLGEILDSAELDYPVPDGMLELAEDNDDHP